jgi:hypothetical protein
MNNHAKGLTIGKRKARFPVLVESSINITFLEEVYSLLV